MSCVFGAPGMRHIHTPTLTQNTNNKNKNNHKKKAPPAPPIKKNRRTGKRTVRGDADRQGSRTIGEADR